jgi:hypothetical protein
MGARDALHATWALVTDMPSWSLAVAIAGVVALLAVAAIRPGSEPEPRTGAHR